MKTASLSIAALLLLPMGPARAGETAETVLIRQAIDKDRSGRRRGDAELAASVCAEHFVAYEGHNLIDPVGWTVQHEDLESYSAALTEKLQRTRYDIRRSVTFLHVWKEKAMVTTVDSGWVVDRASGDKSEYASTWFWVFHKDGEDWLVTGLIEDLGDTTAGPHPGTGATPDANIVALLEEEAAGWRDRDAAAILRCFDDDFTGYEGFFSSNPALWYIILEDAEELEEWLDDRLALVDYDLQRQVIHTSLSAGGTEALAVTQEQVTASPDQGDVKHRLDRRVVWTLSRKTGAWKVTNMLLAMKDYQ